MITQESTQSPVQNLCGYNINPKTYSNKVLSMTKKI